MLESIVIWYATAQENRVALLTQATTDVQDNTADRKCPNQGERTDSLIRIATLMQQSRISSTHSVRSLIFSEQACVKGRI